MGLTRAERANLDQRLIKANLEIAAGKPFYDVLRDNKITHFNLIKNLHRLPSFPELVTDKGKRRTLEGIVADPNRLFLVSEDELSKEYDAVSDGQQSSIHSRNYHHPYNRQFIAYYAVVSTLPSARVFLGEKFSKDKRDLLVSEILGDREKGKSGIPDNHRRFFKARHLNSLMSYHTTDYPGSTQNIWDMVDGYYMRKTGDTSLFDQTRKSHLPDIEKTGWGCGIVYNNPKTMAARVYGILTKKTPEKIARKLASLNRKTIIEGLEDLAESAVNMVKYFRELGLGGAMVAGFNGLYKNSPKAIYAALDYQYQKVSRDKHSLFDTTQPDFSPLMNVEAALSVDTYADKVIYERLIRKNAQSGLAMQSKEQALRGVHSLPHNLTAHLREQGFRKVIRRTYLKDLPLAQAVITGYANHLRRITHGVARLLDNIKFDKRGTLIRY